MTTPTWAIGTSVAVDEHLRALKHVVAVNHRSGYLTGGERITLARGDDPHLVVRDVERLGELHREQERVYAVGTGRDDGHLWPALAAARDEGRSILERIALHVARDHATAAQGLAVARFDDCDLARRNHDRIVQSDVEEQCVDAVSAGRNDTHLRPALALVLQKRTRILERIARHQLCDDAAARQRFAVARLDAADLARRHRAELDQFDSILPGPEAQMQPGGQGVRLISGLAAQRDDTSGGKSAVLADDHEFLGHDADAVVRHHDDAADPQYQTIAEHQDRRDQRGRDDAPVVDCIVHVVPFPAAIFIGPVRRSYREALRHQIACGAKYRCARPPRNSRPRPRPASRAALTHSSTLLYTRSIAPRARQFIASHRSLTCSKPSNPANPATPCC
jgi:hypothetical protein